MRFDKNSIVISLPRSKMMAGGATVFGASVFVVAGAFS